MKFERCNIPSSHSEENRVGSEGQGKGDLGTERWREWGHGETGEVGKTRII